MDPGICHRRSRLSPCLPLPSPLPDGNILTHASAGRWTLAAARNTHHKYEKLDRGNFGIFQRFPSHVALFQRHVSPSCTPPRHYVSAITDFCKLQAPTPGELPQALSPTEASRKWPSWMSLARSLGPHSLSLCALVSVGKGVGVLNGPIGWPPVGLPQRGRYSQLSRPRL